MIESPKIILIIDVPIDMEHQVFTRLHLLACESMLRALSQEIIILVSTNLQLHRYAWQWNFTEIRFATTRNIRTDEYYKSM